MQLGAKTGQGIAGQRLKYFHMPAIPALLWMSFRLILGA